MNFVGDESAALRILIVEDNRLILMILDRMFSKEAFKTTLADSALKAQQYLGLDNEDTSSGRRDELPDLILTDYEMDVMTGFELLKKIKTSALKDIPVVIMSIDDQPDRVDRCIQEGAYRFLKKPVNTDEPQILKEFILRLRAENTHPMNDQPPPHAS